VEEAAPEAFPEDAGDVLRRTEEERAAAEAAEFARRSTALKREPALPRPLVVDEEVVESVVEETGDAALGEALIREEIARLLRHDLAKYPVRDVPHGVCVLAWDACVCVCGGGGVLHAQACRAREGSGVYLKRASPWPQSRLLCLL
jgi:hypothetical protein